MKDLYSHIDPAIAIPPAVYAADQVGSVVDLQGFQAAEILLTMGDGGIAFSDVNKIEVFVEHGDDAGALAAVTSDDIIGLPVAAGGVIKAFTAAHDTPTNYRAGYVGGKQFLRVTANFSGVHGTGSPLAVNIIRGRPSLTVA